MRRRRPALGLAEEVDEALARRRVVVAPSRLDVDLRRQRDREDLALRRLGDAQPEAQRGRGGVLDDLDAEHGELGRDRRRHTAAGGQALGFARGAHAPCRSSAAKNSATASSIARPPEMPSQRDLIMPTSS